MNKINQSPPSIIDGKHRLSVRVYFEDTDAGGIVYYANYLKFAERARTEMMREIGYEHTDTLENYGTSFVVKACNVEFAKPGRLDDLLEVETEILIIRGASINLRQKVKRGDEDLVRMDIKLAYISLNGGPIRIPLIVRDRMSDLIILKGDG